MNLYDHLAQLTRQRLSMSTDDKLAAMACHFELTGLLDKYGEVGLHTIKFMACYKTIVQEEKRETANQAHT